MSVENRDLLFGVLTVQLGFASSGQVMACAAEWATRRTEGKSLAELLEQRGHLSLDQRRMVEGMVAEALKLNQGDVARTLQSLSGGGRSLLKQMSDSVVSGLHDISGQTAQSVGKTAQSSAKTAPQNDSLEGNENVSDEPPGRYDLATGDKGQVVELGRGGIGRVVVARDSYLGRDVALKELLTEHTSNPQLATTRSVALEARFLREARLTGQLEHPAIVPVYEVGRRLGGGLYYTMQQVRGRTLWELIRDGKRLPERLKLISSLLTVCQAIAYSHSRAVVHRDLKPQNIMVGPFGETYVLDWGLARLKGRSDPRARDLKLAPDITGNVLEGGAIGTPSYMSPEQAEGKVEQIDERSDVWGLGAVLYEVLTGRPPYEGVNPFDVLSKILKQPVKPVRELEPDAPRDLAAIAEKALQRDKALRYPSAAQMASDVEAYLQGRRIEAREYGSLELVRRFSKRNRVPLAVATVAVAVLAVASVFNYRQVRRERDEARAFAQLFLDEVSDKLEPVAGAGPLLTEMTSKTLDYYRRVVDPKTGPREERIRLGRAWKKIGRLAYEVGKNDEALPAYQYAVDVARPLVDEAPGDLGGLVLLADALSGVSDVRILQGDGPGCEKLLLEAMELADQAVKRSPIDDDALRVYSRIAGRLGNRLMSSGRVEEGLPYFLHALEIDRRRLSLKPDDDDARLNLAVSLSDLAGIRVRQGDLEQADILLEESLKTGQEVLSRHPEKQRAHSAQAMIELSLGSLRQLMGRGGWSELAEQCVADAEWVLKTDPHDAFADTYRGMCELLLGRNEVLFQRLEAVGVDKLDVDFYMTYVTAAFGAGHDRKAVEAALKSPDSIRTTTYTYGALSAAFLGDGPTAAALARKAAAQEHDELTWMLDFAPERFERASTPMQKLAAELRTSIDAAERKVDPKASRQALRAFADAVEKLPTVAAPH